ALCRNYWATPTSARPSTTRTWTTTACAPCTGSFIHAGSGQNASGRLNRLSRNEALNGDLEGAAGQGPLFTRGGAAVVHDLVQIFDDEFLGVERFLAEQFPADQLGLLDGVRARELRHFVGLAGTGKCCDQHLGNALGFVVAVAVK